MLVKRLWSVVLLASACSCRDEFTKNLARMILQVAQFEGHYNEPFDFETSFFQEEEVSPQKPKVDIPGVGGGTNPKVQTTSGLVEGATDDDAHAFYEIPYAEAPTGELRFQPPRPITTPREIDGKRNDGLQCIQFEIKCVGPIPGCNLIEMDEDCLLLNVFVPSSTNLTDPAKPPAERLPVLFYIHGGAYTGGAGTRTSLDGKELAHVTNTVVVTINYRLGALGFLVHQEEGYADIGGNQGLKDQQLALSWVQDNIANFGGDKTRVTLFGNSAGAQSVMFHTLSQISRPIYARAIQQSNPAVFSYQTPEDSLQITSYLLNALRTAEPTAIAAREPSVMLRALLHGDIMGLVEPYRPVIDGVEYTDRPLHLFRDGKWNSDKSMIIGVNTEELEDAQFYVPENLAFGKGVFTAVNYVMFGIGTTDVIVKKYEEHYPPEKDENWLMTFGIELSHFYFICPSRAMARYASETATGSAKVYFYANDHPVLDSTCQERNNGSDTRCYYSTHADEIRYVFRTVSNPDEEDRAVEDHFSTYWGSFARTGIPSSGLETSLGDFVDWPLYTSDTTQHSEPMAVEQRLRYAGYYAKLLPLLIEAAETGSGGEIPSQPWQSIRIKAQSEVEGNYEEDICNFWDSIGYYMDPILLPETTTTEKTTTSTEEALSTTDNATNPKFMYFNLFLASILAYFCSQFAG